MADKAAPLFDLDGNAATLLQDVATLGPDAHLHLVFTQIALPFEIEFFGAAAAPDIGDTGHWHGHLGDIAGERIAAGGACLFPGRGHRVGRGQVGGCAGDARPPEEAE